MGKGKLRKKNTAVFLAVVMVCSMLFGIPDKMDRVEAATVGDFTVTGGTQGTDYSYSDGILTIKTATELTISNTNSEETTMDTIYIEKNIDANVTLKDILIQTYVDNETYKMSSALAIADDSIGNVTLTITGNDNLLYGCLNPAIQKNGTVGSLTLKGDGTLTANAIGNCAGIGSSEDKSASNIIVNLDAGGKITAVGQTGGAGIGSGTGGDVSNITIKSGTVIAKSYTSGAAIGSGEGGNATGIIISGGTITANSGTKTNSGDYMRSDAGAGIGSGGKGTVDGITISGGTVNAKCVNYSTNGSGAGIGSGSNGSAKNINITDGVVTSTSNQFAAGIGGGTDSSVNGIDISGGTISATGGTSGAGIGSGRNYPATGIVISGGKITANGGAKGSFVAGAGIGGCGGYSTYRGQDNDYTTNISDVTITDGTIVATGGVGAAAIGEAKNYKGKVYISGGSVNATAGTGANAVGSGADGPDAEVCVSSTDSSSVSLIAKDGYTANTKVTLNLIKDKEAYTAYGNKSIYADANGRVYLYLPAGVTVMAPNECMATFSVTVKSDGVTWTECPAVTLVNSKDNSLTYAAKNNSPSEVFTFSGDANDIFKVGTYKIYIDGKDIGKTVAIGEGAVENQVINYYSLSFTNPQNGTIKKTASEELPETILGGEDLSFVVAVENGYKVTSVGYKVNDGTTVPIDVNTNNEYLISKDAITGPVKIIVETEEIVTDEKAPTGTITIDGVSFSSMQDSIAFSPYKLSSNAVSITATDDKTGVKAIDYIISDKVYTATTIKDSELTWTTGKISGVNTQITYNKNQVVYVRLTDNAGNVSYLSTKGIYADDVAPTVSSAAIDTAEGFTAKKVNVSFYIDDAATYYYEVLPATSSITREQLIAAASTSQTGGKGTLTAKETVSKEISNLSPNTAYKLYVVAVDNALKLSDATADGNVSVIATSAAVTTPKEDVVVNELPVVSGTYGQTLTEMVSGMSSKGKVTVLGDTSITVDGKWSVKENGTSKPSAGSASVTLLFTPKSEQYKTIEQDVTATIAKRDIANATLNLDKTSYAYDFGNAIRPGYIVSDSLVTITSDDYDVEYSDNTAVGTKATVTIKGKNNYTGSKSVTFEITKGTGTIAGNQIYNIKQTADSYEYTLSDLLLANYPANMGTITYTAEKGSEADIVDTLSVNGDKLNFTTKDNLKVGAEQKIKVTIQSDNYADATATITLQVSAKTQVTLLKADTETDLGVKVAASYTYNGKSQGYTGDIIWKNGNDTVSGLQTKVTYTGTTSAGATYSSETTAPTDAGSYTVTFTVVNSEDYVGSLSFGYSIAKAEVPIGTLIWSPLSPTYDGKLKTVTASGYATDLLTANYSGNTATDAGDYTASVTFTVKDSNNYTVASTQYQMMWKIEKATCDMSKVKWPNQKEYTYSEGNIVTIQVENLPDEVKANYSGDYSMSESGSYTAKVSFEPKNSNYQLSKTALEDFAWSIVASASGGEENKDDKNQKEADKVIDLINQIGSVSANSKDAIEAARAAYESLSDEQKELISEAIMDKLEDAEDDYEAIVGYPVDEDEVKKNQEAANKVIELINHIGTVTADSKNILDMVRAAYMELTEEQKEMVTNVGVLDNAEDIYEEIIATKDDVIIPEVGDVEIVKNLEYEIIQSSVEGGTVIVTGIDNANVNSITVPSTIRIEDYIFKVIEIAPKAFKNCKNVKKVVIGANVELIGAYAFQNNKKLSKVTIGKNVKSIGKYAFSGDVLITKITIPSKVSTIGDYAFYGNKKLNTVVIGSGVRTIGKKAFYNDKVLRKMVVKSKKLKNIGSKAFYNTHKKLVVKVPSTKVKSYKKIFKKAGIKKTATVKR